MNDDPIRGQYVSAPLEWVPVDERARARITTPLPAAPPLPGPAYIPAPVAPRAPRGGAVSALLLAAVLIFGLLIGGAGGGAVAYLLMPHNTQVAALAPAPTAPQPVVINPAPATAPSQPVASDQTTVGAVYKAVAGSVVVINVTIQGSGRFGRGSSQGEGTGIVLDTQGHILTNNHVVDGASSIQVQLLDGTNLDAQVVGTAPQDDLAVIQANIPADKLVTAVLGVSAVVQVGDPVIAIGNPFGLDHTVTTGIISAINRDYAPDSNSRVQKGMLQTDAAINPGNSGGPLLNMSGQVIGINTAIQSPVGASDGLGFAIPIDRAKSLLPQLIGGTTVVRPWLGISGVGITPALAQQYKLPVQSGVLVVSVVAGSPAAQAGLVGVDPTTDTSGAIGDIVTAIDGQTLRDTTDLIGYLNSKAVGDTVTLSVNRSGQTLTIKATLAPWQDQTQQQPLPQTTP